MYTSKRKACCNYQIRRIDRTNRLETALEQTASVFMEMAKEIRALKEEIADIQVLVHRHESINCELARVFKGGNY